MPIWLILFVLALYLSGLFAMAWKRDRRAEQPGFRQGPVVYSLAIAVYCTSWTYFGAVGTAASSGWDYLPIYLGPAIVFLVLPGLIRRIGDVAQREGINSLSDFLSARYGKSRAVATLATLAAVTGSLPYISLQLKSVGMSLSALASRTPETTANLQPADETMLVTALALAAFAILFGARYPDSTRKNAGLMAVLAFEALVKLFGLVAIAILALVILTGPDAPVAPALTEVFPTDGLTGRFVTITLLSMGAIICLPRQFHVAILERRSPDELRTARWLFPLYLLATSLAVIPITLAGIAILPPDQSGDLYVLQLPLMQGDGVLALLVFLGGFSAAMGMVIVSSIALSTMVTNDLIVPLLMRFGRLSSLLAQRGGTGLLLVRRMVILVLVLLAFVYYRLAGSSEALAQIGLLSFAAAVQFAPALIGAVYWPGGRRAGALAGLGIGMALWCYTLFLPAIFGIDAMRAAVPGFLDPHGLLGWSMGDSLTHGVVWSVLPNLLAFIAFSISARERLRDRVQAAAFTGEQYATTGSGSGPATLSSKVTPDGLKALAARFLDVDAVDNAFARIGRSEKLSVTGDRPADWRLVQHTERMLASALGASSARVVMASAIGGMDVALPDVLSILDQQTQAQRFDRHMLQSMLENLAHGISVVDHRQRLVAWNSAYVDLFNYPGELMRVGTPVADLIRHNIDSGWIEGNPAEEAERRMAFMRAGHMHVYERQNPDGRYLRISGNPMPGGGYVTIFADITQDKLRQQALVEANETLEARVRERTRALEAMAADLSAAREDAEGANASKTRFLAAASHDLLQPLNAARLFLGALMADREAPDRVRNALAKTDKAIQSADDLLKGLLDISRLDHGRITPHPVDIPLGPLLEDLADEAAPMAAQAGIEIRVAPTGLAVHADPDFLTSILRNFISNARRYTDKGGVLVGARRRGGQVRIEVWDTGHGIDEDKQALLFEEFQRFEEIDNLGLRGAGLGLSVASRLAGLMDARIDVRSQRGRGSVFSITLPGANVPMRKPAQPDGPPIGAPNALTGLRVLCIDDEISIRDAMGTLLESWRCVPLVAASHDEALALAQTADFDVIIADLQLRTARTGLDVIEALRTRLPDAANAALLTAQASIDVLDCARQIAVPVLRKPADPEALRDFLYGCAARLPAQAAE